MQFFLFFYEHREEGKEKEREQSIITETQQSNWKLNVVGK
jgi:hypothetical protein